MALLTGAVLALGGVLWVWSRRRDAASPGSPPGG
jgi:hypothetical protein